MSDDGLPPLEAFERELEELGSLMAEQELAFGVEPDPEFVRSLRNRLTGETQPAVARESPPERLLGWTRRYWVQAGGLAAAVAVALIVVLGGRHGAGSPVATPVQSAFRVPTPGRSDLTRSYPIAGGLGAGPPPIWSSNLAPPPGAPYAGHLTLQGRPIAAAPDGVDAYRLDGPQFDLPRLRAMAHTLGISGPVRHITVQGTRWAYVAQQAGIASLHSIAIDERTGELIYHNLAGNAPVPPRVTDAQVAAARTWLAKLGWPANAMSSRTPTPAEAALPWVVRLDWLHTVAGIQSDVPAASVSLNTRGTVTDAVLEPPIRSGTPVQLVSPQAAWNTLKHSGGPIGVEGMIGLPVHKGTATLADTQVIEVLTRTPDGTSYLVPSYRFEGTATIRGVPGTKRWVAIVPAVK
jgi:hypothetical protein